MTLIVRCFHVVAIEAKDGCHVHGEPTASDERCSGKEEKGVFKRDTNKIVHIRN